MSETDPRPQTDPTGFPCPHKRVRDGMARMDREHDTYRQSGICYVCGYAVERSRPPAKRGDRPPKFAPWQVVAGARREPDVVRRTARR